MPLKIDFLHNNAQKMLESGNQSRIRWFCCSLLLKWGAMPIRVSERSMKHCSAHLIRITRVSANVSILTVQMVPTRCVYGHEIHLQNYIQSRTDSNRALFVSLNSPRKRLEISGVEIRLRTKGKQLNLHKVHPHKFRRTLATMVIDKGMPIEQVQHLLGHQSLDTTLQYAMVNQSNIVLTN